MERYFPDLSRAWYIRTYGVVNYLDLVGRAKQTVVFTETGLEEIIRKNTEELKDYG